MRRWPGDDPFSLVGVLRFAGVGGQDGFVGLFGLQEQHLGVDSCFEQQNPRSGADTAHSDHLVCHVGEGEVIEQVPSVDLEGAAVGGDQIVQSVEQQIGVESGELVDRDDQRWIADDPPRAVDNGGQLPDRLETVAGVRLREHVIGSLELGASLLRFMGGERGFVLGEGVVDVEVRVPDVEDRPGGEGSHRCAICADGRERSPRLDTCQHPRFRFVASLVSVMRQLA
ncbi:hypothetical protein R4369_29475 [Rhodococcus opacus]|nr:hypothetical protein [Rhodococcus opacus]MDV7088303.1 hypothetical protein [Rhodococcus opacus]